MPTECFLFVQIYRIAASIRNGREQIIYIATIPSFARPAALVVAGLFGVEAGAGFEFAFRLWRGWLRRTDCGGRRGRPGWCVGGRARVFQTGTEVMLVATCGFF